MGWRILKAGLGVWVHPAIMDGYTTPPQFPINPPLNAHMGAGMQHLAMQLQARFPPDGPQVFDYAARPSGESLGPLDERFLLLHDRVN